MNITTGKKDKPRRCLVYGTNCIGKSTFANNAPNPIFVQTEEGLGDIDVNGAFDFCYSFDQVMEQLNWLYGNDHEYKTVVIDTLDFLERLIWKQVSKDKGVKTIEEIDFSKGYKLALLHWQRVIDVLNALWNTKNMMVILLAHTEPVDVKDPDNGGYNTYRPNIHKVPCGILQDWCDEVFFCRHKLYVTTEGKGFNEVNRATNSGIRVAKTVSSGTHDAKNRLGMPDEFPFDLNAFKFYQEYIDKNKASKTKPVAEATQKKAETK